MSEGVHLALNRRIRLAALVALAALVSGGCRARPLEPLPTPPPWTPVPLSPQAITPENARQVKAVQCLQQGYARALAFSPDGALLATGSEDGLHCFWRVEP